MSHETPNPDDELNPDEVIELDLHTQEGKKFIKETSESVGNDYTLRLMAQVIHTKTIGVLESLGRRGVSEAEEMQWLLTGPMKKSVKRPVNPDLFWLARLYEALEERETDPDRQQAFRRRVAMSEAAGAIAFIDTHLVVRNSPTPEVLHIAASDYVRNLAHLVTPDVYETFSGMLAESISGETRPTDG